MKRNTHWAGLALAATLAALTLLIGANADSASAKSDIYAYDSFPSSTQAGGHPDIFTEFELGSRLTANPPVPCFCNDPKIVINHLPAGVIANPHVVSECKIAQLALFECPADSQAGIVALKLFGYGGFPLFRVTPSKSQAAVFAFLLPLRGCGAAVPGVQRENGKRLRARRRIDRHLAPPATPLYRTDLLGSARRPLLRPAAVQAG